MLRLGDVVVVIDPSAPEVIEVKGERLLMPRGLAVQLERRAERSRFDSVDVNEARQRGRAGRQLQQITSRDVYLRTDRGRLPGDVQERIAITVHREPEMLFADVEAATLGALRSGFAVQRSDDGHVIIGVAAGRSEGESLIASREFMAEMRYPAFGMNLRPYNDLWWVAPPPTEWRISEDAAWALMDGDVVIAHVVDLGVIETASSATMQFEVRKGKATTNVIIRVGDAEFTLGEKFVWDAVHGFERITSVAARAAEMTRLVLKELPELTDG